MLIRRADRVEGTPVTMDGAHAVTMRMMVGRADGAPTFAMRHFTVEPDGHTPRHQHNYEHEVVIVEGQGRVECDGEFHDLYHNLVVHPRHTPQAPANVPARCIDHTFRILHAHVRNRVHQFVNVGTTPFRFLCLVPLEFDGAANGRQPVPGS